MRATATSGAPLPVVEAPPLRFRAVARAREQRRELTPPLTGWEKLSLLAGLLMVCAFAAQLSLQAEHEEPSPVMGGGARR